MDSDSSTTVSMELNRPASSLLSSSNLYDALKILTDGLLPTSIVNNNQVLVEKLGLQWCSQRQLDNYVSRLAKVVEKKIEKLLPEKFALILDKWDDATGEAYLSLFATFPSNRSIGYQKVMLSVVKPEGKMGVGQAITTTLRKYDVSHIQIVAVIATAVMPILDVTKKLSLPFVSCVCFELSATVKELMKTCNPVLKARAVMRTLLEPLMQEKLEALTDIPVVQEDEQNIETSYRLLLNFRRLIPFIPRLPFPEGDYLTSMLPIPYELQELKKLILVIDVLLKCRRDFMQGSWTMPEVREKLNSLLSKLPQTAPYLKLDGRFDGCAVFEKAVIKVCTDASELTGAEYEFVHHLRPGISRDVDDPQNAVFTPPARPFRKDHFMDLRFIIPNANHTEVTLRDASYDVGSVRNGVVAPAISQQLFLKVNSELWGPEDVDALLH